MVSSKQTMYKKTVLHTYVRHAHCLDGLLLGSLCCSRFIFWCSATILLYASMLPGCCCICMYTFVPVSRDIVCT